MIKMVDMQSGAFHLLGRNETAESFAKIKEQVLGSGFLIAATRGLLPKTFYIKNNEQIILE
jgi:hypothetical protein